MTDGTVSNSARHPQAAMPLSTADLHAVYRAADPGNGFSGLTPTQPLWATPAPPAAEGTLQEIHLPALPLESVADTESLPAGPRGGVHALFNLDVKAEAPFPTNWFTVPDRTQNTGRRVSLPLPDCKVYVSDCEDIAVLNTLDGFNMQPRFSIPFDGPIDVNSVTSSTMFLVSLGDTLNRHDHGGQVVGINQVVWDVATSTLHVESDALLDQHTRYALIVTNGVHDAEGHPVEASDAFRRFRHDVRGEYGHELLDAIHAARRLGVRESDIVTASVFTTESATAVLEKIRDQIHAGTPAPADFLLGARGTRTVFPLDQVKGITWNQQVGADPPTFNTEPLPLRALQVVPGAVGEIAFGKYLSPDYEIHPGEYIPPVATRNGTPVVQRLNEIYFNLFLPSGPRPEGGWPVAIFGHGFTSNKNNNVRQAPFSVLATMAAHGMATVAINVPGNGFGPLGSLTVDQTKGDAVTFPDGGRGIDQDGDHVIGDNEGQSAAAPRVIIENRDGIRQTVADLMQLVRVIQVGMDVHGDGSRALDPSRIYYFGQSLGGTYGTDFLAVEPSVGAGVLNVPSGPFFESLRLGRYPAVVQQLVARVPSLINSPGITQIDGVPVFGPPFFHENMPLRNSVSLAAQLADGTSSVIRSPLINTVAGAMELQEFFKNSDWVSQSASPVAYAPHLRKAPLAGVPAKSVIIQFGKGDQTAHNPGVTALLRAGDLADRATFYRHDLAFAEIPALPRNPHSFMVSSTNPDWAAIALGAQEQIATFLASDGKTIIHPEPARFYEVPIQGPLPEELNYIP
jgi:hypothetical protein